MEAIVPENVVETDEPVELDLEIPSNVSVAELLKKYKEYSFQHLIELRSKCLYDIENIPSIQNDFGKRSWLYNLMEKMDPLFEAAHLESRKIDKKFTKWLFEKDDGNKENIESEKGSELQKTGETSGKENKNKKKECTEPSKEETDEAVDQNSASQGDENSRKNKQKEEGEKDTTEKKRKRKESSQEEIDEDAVDQDRKKKKSKKKERKELSQEEIDEDAVDQDGKKKKTKKKERKEPSKEEMDEDAVDQDGKKKKPKKTPEFVQYDTGYNYYCPVKTCDWSETRNVFQFKRLDSVKRHCKTKHSKFYGEGAPKSRMLKVLWRDAPKRRNLCLKCNQIVANLTRHRQKCPGEPKGVALSEMPQTYTLADKELLYNLYAVDYVAQISTKQVQDDCQKNNHLNQLFNQMKTAKGTVRRVIASFKYIVNAYGQTKKEEEAEGEELHGQMPQDDINHGKTSYSEADKELLYQLFAVDYAPSVTSQKMDEYCKTNEQFKELFDRVKEDKGSKKKIRISFKNCLYDYCKLKKREDAGGDMAKTRQRLRRRTMTKWTTSSLNSHQSTSNCSKELI